VSVGDSVVGERACPMCRAEGALCGFHRQMFSEEVSPTGNTALEGMARFGLLERAEYLSLWKRNQAAGRKSGPPAESEAEDADL